MNSRNDNNTILTEEQINFFIGKGIVENYSSEQILINEGQKQYDFIVILEGTVNIIDPLSKELIVIHGSNEFIGDIDILSERAAIFRAIATNNTTIVRIPQTTLLAVLAENANLNNLLINAFLIRREALLKKDGGGLIIVGSETSAHTFTIRDFLNKNHVRHTLYTVETSAKAQEIINKFGILATEMPVVIDANSTVYKQPTLPELAEVTGVYSNTENKIFDVVIVGAGPGGLAASVYGASEGLNVITIDSTGPGGQASTTSKIENYLGFPMGISGTDLAQKAYVQAQKFGCTISVPACADKLYKENNIFTLQLTNGNFIKAKTVIAATGAKYRNLSIDNLDMFYGNGIYYSATAMEASICKNKIVGVVGAGNSAGQAAIYLSEFTKQVYLIVRGDSLYKSMSSYLVHRILGNTKITVLYTTEVNKLIGATTLNTVELYDKSLQKTSVISITRLFLFLGAVPANNWLIDTVCTDAKGFVLTGNNLNKQQLEKYQWNLNREPFSLETCVPGLFAIGDLRSNSTKRVAAAVGEGAMAISYVHNYLKIN